MEYSHDDEGLARQPIGYWSWAAYQAVVSHIRGNLATLGLTQPQWWVLHRVASSGNGRSREELTDILQGYLDIGEALQEEIDAVADRALIAPDEDKRFRVTEAGQGVYAQAAALVGAARQRIHDGIPEEEYVRTLKVLQRMIHNVGGEAWHE